jgi:N-acetylglutamate synthase-like GNAT family acetyltransferase
MKTIKPVVALHPFLERDIEGLTTIMTRAFDDDAQKHLGKARGGPEGYDNGDFFRKWLFSYKESEGFKIIHQEQVVGGIIVWNLPGGHNILGTIFIDPDFQDQGLGTATWQAIEAKYPQAKNWRLGTPDWATKNHHFYQKCGFRKVDSDALIPPEEGLTVYFKECQRQEMQGEG